MSGQFNDEDIARAQANLQLLSSTEVLDPEDPNDVLEDPNDDSFVATPLTDPFPDYPFNDTVISYNDSVNKIDLFLRTDNNLGFTSNHTDIVSMSNYTMLTQLQRHLVQNYILYSLGKPIFYIWRKITLFSFRTCLKFNLFYLKCNMLVFSFFCKNVI